MMTAKLATTFVGLALTIQLGACLQAGRGSEEVTSRTVLSIEGEWTVTEQCDETDCGNGLTTDTYVLIVTQKGSNITVTDPDANQFKGELEGRFMRWSGSYPEDGGTTTITSLVATLEPSGESLSGTDSWTWSDGFDSCSGTCTFSAIKAVR